MIDIDAIRARVAARDELDTDSWVGTDRAALLKEVDRLREERDAMLKTILVWWRSKRPGGWVEEDHVDHPFVNLLLDSEKPLAAMAAAAHPEAKVGFREGRRCARRSRKLERP